MKAVETLNQLINIYGRYQTTDEVESDAEFLDLCKAHGDNELDPFQAERKTVKEVSGLMENSLKNHTSQGQVKHSLRIYQRFVRSSTKSQDQIWLQLARLRHYSKWTVPQQEYFDRICTIIATKLDYFLSFTQRNEEGQGNPINDYHRYSIQYLGQLPDPVMSPKNELAEMVHRFLKKNNLRGFFFPTHEMDSTQVNERLSDKLSQSLVFIQLVQNEMFSDSYPPVPNYCFTEYTQATAENKSILMVFANGVWKDDLIKDDYVLLDLDSWYRFVDGAALMFLEPTRLNSEYDKNRLSNEARLKDPLLLQVENARRALWENAPDK